ncbi:MULTISPECIES: type II toxin-antitoxin system HicB family antitoxin [Tepidimonas]|uniref:HicB-like antitoxin of bacterial toxin-antitoxin system n=3 Tax=Tepidimonas TaxID=114248 RepID=A0A554X300_9BURK|nr:MULTISPECIES: type II toxin-antitoxin system HicB family antitoxin [Tepidimonas]TCS94103.1 putative RNase H-like HicB family nuclease [Tepidimonas ignava]TSE18929.1 antitoxin of bacterial toxin-antitoxin system [Tepidimonas ignava]TSE30207.1 HicB-like antitoxin of bacterial toxin-antitoxin system [Tepidimonas charontis]
MKYPVVLHTDDGVRYGVTVPDLPGCFSAGDTLEQALQNVVEAIELHLEGLTEDGGEVPQPSPLSEHVSNPDYAGGVWALVEVDTARFDGKAEKINITLPRRLLARVDEYARARGMTRSGFLAQAAQQAMRG